MRVATWNVNSIRVRIGQLLEWLDQHHPDVVLLQETRCPDDQFPYADIHSAGYEVVHHALDHHSGVAICSRVGLDDVTRGFDGVSRPPFDEARIVSATCDGIRVHSVYAPNGRELDDPHYLYKLVWLERLRTITRPGMSNLIGGDLNVAPTDLDIYDPRRWRRRTHASPQERAAITALVDDGLVDVTRLHHPGPDIYTWWSYRPGMFETNRGLRIDLLLASADLAERTTSVMIDHKARAADRPSDHAPVIMDTAS